MRYGYLDGFRRGISVFAIFSYGNAVLGTPPNVPLQRQKTTRENTGWAELVSGRTSTYTKCLFQASGTKIREVNE